MTAVPLSLGNSLGDRVVVREDRSWILAECEAESERQLRSMRSIAQEMFGGDTDYLVGVNGSVARRECTSGSDVDLFFLHEGSSTVEAVR